MKNCTEDICKTGPVPETDAQTACAKMTNHVNILGFKQPEKLAEGPCPHCTHLVALWATAQGLVLSFSNHHMEAPASNSNSIDIDANCTKSKPIKSATTLKQSIKMDNVCFINNPLNWLKAKISRYF